MDLARIDDHDVSGRAVVGRIATRESLHAMQRHADGVGVVRVAVIRELVERCFQQLDALTSAGPAHTLAASHPMDHNKASGCQIFLSWLTADAVLREPGSQMRCATPGFTVERIAPKRFRIPW